MRKRRSQAGHCVIRDLVQADSAAIARLLVQLAEETPYVLLSPAESRAAAETQSARTAALLATSNQKIFVADSADELLGFLALTQGLFAKNAHVASMMLGIVRSAWGCSLGHRLLQAAMGWARARGIRRVEVGVMADNARALAFYARQGFTREGLKRQALMVDGSPVDEVLLALVEGD